MSSWPPHSTLLAASSTQINTDNTVRRGPVPVVINLIFMVVAAGVGIFRLYTRAFVSKVFGSDDVFIIFAILFTIANGIEVHMASTRFYFDRHIWELSDDLVAANNTHISWMCFYYRLSSNTGIEWFRRTLHACVATIMGLFTIYLALAIRLCLPIKAVWAWPPLENANCIRRGEVTFSGGIVKILIDVLLITLPYPLIARLKLSVRERAAVLFLFSLGILVTIFGSLRSYYTWRIYFRTDDFSWYAYWAYFWSALEHYAGIICACMPPLRPLSNATIQRLIRAGPPVVRRLPSISKLKESRISGTPSEAPLAKLKPSVELENDSAEQND